MSYTVTDSLSGRRVEVTYGAAQLTLPGGSRRLRGRVVRRHLARHRGRHALLVRGESGLETWWAAEDAGVSIAAAAEAWMAGSEREIPDGTLLAIPLDERVWLGRTARSLIEDERVLPPEAACGEIDRARDAGTVVWAFEGGGAADAVRRRLDLEPLPFDPLALAFRPAWRVLGRAGIPHRAHLSAVAALAVLVGAGAFLAGRIPDGILDALTGRFGSGIPEAPVAAVTGPATRIAPEADHSGADSLRRLARLAFDARILHRDGLSGLVATGDGVALSGRSGGWPETARSFALDAGGEWSAGESGWSAVLPLSAEPLRRAVENGASVLHPALIRLGWSIVGEVETVPSRRNLIENTVTRELFRSRWRRIVDDAVLGSLIEAAEALDGLPAALTGAECRFGSLEILSCELSLEVNAL